jgi:hypothetical protein
VKLYIDLDGVLADFDTGAQRVIGTTDTYKWEWVHGTTKFWGMLDAADEFFYNLPPMADADFLWGAVKHLNPTILTALPKRGAAAVDQQKRAWVAENLGIDVPVITCQTSEKPDYCLPGDVLIDDRTVNAERWNGALGTFVWHIDAYRTVGKLKHLGVI